MQLCLPSRAWEITSLSESYLDCIHIAIPDQVCGYLASSQTLNYEKMSRAVVPTATIGDPVELYKLVTKDIPKASSGNVVVRLTLRPVNPTDSLVIQWGVWAGHDLDKLVVGSEGTGVVYEVLNYDMQIAFCSKLYCSVLCMLCC